MLVDVITLGSSQAVNWIDVGSKLFATVLNMAPAPSSWVDGTAPCDCSGGTCVPVWIGVTCSDVGITGVMLPGIEATGHLPASWSTVLPHIQNIDLHNNSFTGSLPDSWSALTELRSVSLALNELTSTLPPSWSAMVGLATLHLQQNHFAGSIPESWSAMSLGTLRIGSNPKLCGPLPAWMDTNKAENFIANTTGTSVGQTCWQTALMQIRDDWQGTGTNALQNWDPSTCTCDGQLGCCGDMACNQNGVLVRLDLQECAVKTLPQQISSLTALTELVFRTNNISSTLPPSWSTLTRLGLLSAQGQAVSGPLPTEWGALTALTYLDLSMNKITGTIPSSWSAMPLDTLHLGANPMSGTLPSILSWALTDLDLGACHLTGPLPVQWSSMSALTALNLKLNHLTGGLPPAWSALGALTYLALGDNSLTGSIPTPWTALTQLQTLRLINNPGLCGPLPPASPWVVRAMDQVSAPGENELNIENTGLGSACVASSGSGGMSGGAVAGLVIGLLLAVALLAGGAWWLWLRYRRSPRPLVERKFTLEEDPYQDFREQLGQGHAVTVVSKLSRSPPGKGSAPTASNKLHNLDMELHNF